MAAAISPARDPASSSTRAVLWVPGCTLLTVTPSPATSLARLLRKLVTAARAADEAIRWPIGWRAPSEVIATTRPQPRSRMPGTAARHIAMVARQFCSRAAR